MSAVQHALRQDDERGSVEQPQRDLQRLRPGRQRDAVPHGHVPGHGVHDTYNYTHARYEGYREATLSGTSTELDPGQTKYQYDVNGNLVGVVDTKDGSKNQTLVNDASGKILQRVQDGKTTRSLIVNGELLGTTGPTVGADDFSPSFRPIDGGNPQASPGSYRIQPGDTLQTIAQQAYGDSRLWFLVAEANGLASDRDLRVGATVTIPNRVSGNHNDYKTFKPYDPGKLIGDTQPTMIRFTALTVRDVGVYRHFATSYYITQDGVLVQAVTVLNKSTEMI